MKYQIRHLNIGGIMDQAITVTKDNFGALLSIMVFLYIPANLIVGFVALSIMPQPPAFGAGEAEQAAYLQEVMKNFPLIIGMSLFLGLIILPVTNAAVVDSVSKLYLGKPTSATASIGTAFGKLLPLLGVSILTGLSVVVGFVLCVIPGIIFALWFSMATHVVIIEGIGGTAAMGRSKELVSGNIGTLFVLGLLLFIIGVASGFGVGMIPQPHVQLILRILVQAAITILSTAVMVVFYFSCRCNLENFDLQHLASAVGETADFPEPNDEFGQDFGRNEEDPFAG